MQCAFRFKIYNIFLYLFELTSTTPAQVTTFVYLLMEMACWLHVLFVLTFSIHLFTYSKRCQQKQRKSPSVFIYLCKSLLVTHGFRFNIQYPFVYLFKAMSTTAAQITTCFYLLMQIGCWLHVVFVLILIIYLFIYSKGCQQKHLERTTCFYLLMQIGCWLHVLFVLIFSIYLFIYSKRCQQKQVEPITCSYLLMQITCCEIWFSF